MLTSPQVGLGQGRLVGGRLEVETPRVTLIGTDYRYLLTLILLATTIHTVILMRSTMTARDGIEFARFAAHLSGPLAVEHGMPHWFSYIQTANHPPGYPALVAAVSRVVQLVWDRPYQEQLLLSCKLVSALAGILLVIPTYRLARGLFESPFAGFAAAMLFQIAPTVAHTTSDGLSESVFLLMATISLSCGVRGMRRASTLWCLLCGMTSGLAYLVRPEGVMVAVSLCVVAVAQGLLRRWPLTVAFGRLLALIIGFAIVGAPYMVLIGNISNKPSTNKMMEKSPLWKIKTGQVQANPQQATLVGDWYNPERDGNQRLWAVKTIVSETWKSSHYSPFVLAICGLFLFRRQIFQDPGMAAVISLAVVNTSLLMVLGLRTLDPNSNYGPYISERHTLLLVELVCLFAGGVLGVLGKSYPLRAWMFLAVLVAAGVPATIRPLHDNRTGFYYAGLFLAEQNLGPDDVVIDPFSWSEWYAGRTLKEIHKDSDTPKVRWAILDDKPDDHHSRLPRLKDALNVKNDGANKAQIVYYWPENGPVEKAKVMVYRQEVK